MSLVVTSEQISWNKPINETRARDVLRDSFDQAVSRGEGYCECRAAGMWDANEPEYFQAYKAAARVARLKA